MRKLQSFAILAILLAGVSAAWSQTRPYIGFVYPAGGQQGTNVQIRLGGQGMDDVNTVLVSGTGVKARIVEYHRRLNNQEQAMLSEQLRALKRSQKETASSMNAMMKAEAPMMKTETPMMASESSMMMMSGGTAAKAAAGPTTADLIPRLERRIDAFVQTPACASIATLLYVEVTIAPDAPPGEREIRVGTLRGVSNPLAFHVGQVPEYTRKPMRTATIQVLGKEALSLRKRPPEEVEERVVIPCTANGQIASGEVNRYRFEARQGQRLVISTLARQLIPYIADAVPGWFQPVLALYDASGKEVAYNDDYRFRPDPTILYEVPKDGEFVVAIFDGIYRGREDFVYRLTIGELPFITSIFPLGTQVGVAVTPRMKGWNLQDSVLTPPAQTAPGIQSLVAIKKGIVSNPVPFVVDRLPNGLDKEPNNTPASAQKITLPIIINGRIDRPDDWDVFQFAGKSNETIVVDVEARRLDSPVDSVIKLTDAKGKLLALNDDREDLGAGVNTHSADSYFMVKLPATGLYYVHIGDTARKGGEEYGYRLRISAPQPDFELRVVPSSISLRTNSTATLTVYAARKDGFAGPIKLDLKDPPPGFSASPVWVAAGQNTMRLTFKGPPAVTKEPVSLTIVGSAKMGEKEIVHEVVPAEDRMQAFLWRHLVPATDLKVLAFEPNYEPPLKRPLPARYLSVVAANTAVTKAALATNGVAVPKAAVPTNAPGGTNAVAAAKPKFSKSQVTNRLREIKNLFEEGLLTEEFCCEKAAECEVAQ